MGAEAGVHHKLAEVGWFAESDRGGFGEEVLGGRIRGEDVEAFSEDPFETDVLAMLTCRPDDALSVLGKCHSVPLPYLFVCFLPFKVFLIIYTNPYGCYS